jgi:hypothetical protein
VRRPKRNSFLKVFEACDTCMMSFELWMSRGGVDTFVLIVHFLNHNWGLGHVIIGLYETIEILGVAMTI